MVSLEGSLRTAGTGYEGRRRPLGARVRRRCSVRITLPLVLPRPDLRVRYWLSRAALGEFGATITFAGGACKVATRTLPLEIYLQRETDPDAAVALALVLLIVAALIVIASASHRLAGPV